MTIKLISTALILITIYFCISHGRAILVGSSQTREMFARFHIGRPLQVVLGVLTLLVVILLVFPQTFVAGNLLNLALILSIMIFQLRSRNIKGALIEIPFLLMPLLMIYLRHPLRR
ncbi:hypothetical protein [Granulicella sp. S156]|uniref:hypothetical protein n=1 Tax=Granulicella sp. S156 TaxID=1747224 RepID=UPI00131CCA93|nr:hypothetical protein [Granulicella sp. S156]